MSLRKEVLSPRLRDWFHRGIGRWHKFRVCQYCWRYIRQSANGSINSMRRGFTTPVSRLNSRCCGCREIDAVFDVLVIFRNQILYLIRFPLSRPVSPAIGLALSRADVVISPRGCFMRLLVPTNVIVAPLRCGAVVLTHDLNF